MKLIALSPISHDGKTYEAGEPLNIGDKAQALSLVDCGAAMEIKPDSKKTAAPEA